MILTALKLASVLLLNLVEDRKLKGFTGSFLWLVISLISSSVVDEDEARDDVNCSEGSRLLCLLGLSWNATLLSKLWRSEMLWTSLLGELELVLDAAVTCLLWKRERNHHFFFWKSLGYEIHEIDVLTRKENTNQSFYLWGNLLLVKMCLVFKILNWYQKLKTKKITEK